MNVKNVKLHIGIIKEGLKIMQRSCNWERGYAPHPQIAQSD
jgi:hypothetical protein